MSRPISRAGLRRRACLSCQRQPKIDQLSAIEKLTSWVSVNRLWGLGRGRGCRVGSRVALQDVQNAYLAVLLAAGCRTFAQRPMPAPRRGLLVLNGRAHTRSGWHRDREDQGRGGRRHRGAGGRGNCHSDVVRAHAGHSRVLRLHCASQPPQWNRSLRALPTTCGFHLAGGSLLVTKEILPHACRRGGLRP